MKLKSLHKKLLSVECTSTSAFFTFTLWIVGLYFLASIFFLPQTLGQLRIIDQWELCLKIARYGIAALTLITILKLISLFYAASARRKWLHYAFWPMMGLSILVPAEAAIHELCDIPWAVAAFFGIWFLAWLFLPGVRWYTYLGSLLCWAGGALVVFTITYNIRSPHAYYSITHPSYDNGYDRSFADYYHPHINQLWSLPEFFNFTTLDWLCFLLLGIALLAAGYWLTAKIFAEIDGLPWRRMFGKGVLALWGVAAAIYLGFTVMALTESYQTRQNIKILEQRFGRPLTMEALGQEYYNGDQPNMKFWIVLDDQRIELGNISDKIKFYDDPLSDLTPEKLVEARQKFAQIEPTLTRWEQAFTAQNPAPPLKRKYLPGNEMELIFYDVPIVSSFNDWELWRLRLALANKETALALQTFQRIKTVDDILLRENNLCGISHWLYCEEQRLDALQRLLESGGLTDTQLESIKTDLQTTEMQIPAMRERWYYGDTVARLDVYDRIGYGFRERSKLPLSPPLYYLQWAFPQAWWLKAKEKNAKIQLMIREYVKNEEITSWPQSHYDTQLKCFTARLRAAKTVIRAIEYQQKHGRYPETLDDLPSDPFTGKPMHYHVGEYQTVLMDKVNRHQTEYPRQTIDAVVCWSVGRDQADSQNIDWHPTVNESESDDAAFVVRIKP